MAVRPFKEISPAIAASAYVDEQAVVIGDVVIGKESSLWPMAVARGDVNHIRIGDLTNIQDGSVLHVTHAHPGAPEGGYPLIIGNEVTVGHNVTLHGCTVGDRCLIGMGSIVLDGARLEPEVLLGAGSLVPPNKVLEGGYLWLGNPARKVRPLTDAERDWLPYSARHYARLAEGYRG
jgi:carbonic anhydrase/acetyltransferase-like protein (isoleucine patch superfamily)